MNKKQKILKIEMTIFALFVFVSLGVILVTEKSSGILIPKVEEKFNDYIEKNYKELNLNKSKVTYNALKYTMKLTDKRNKNYYFYLYYKDKKITNTYKEDYIEGKTFIKKTTKVIKDNIKNKTNGEYTIIINNKLNDFTKEVQNKLIETKKPEELKIYIIEKSLIFDNYTANEIYKKLYNIITSLEKNNIHPKTYSFIVTDNNDITSSVKIYNIKLEDISNPNIITIINDIINDNNSEILKTTKIKYKVLN